MRFFREYFTVEWKIFIAFEKFRLMHIDAWTESLPFADFLQMHLKKILLLDPNVTDMCP